MPGAGCWGLYLPQAGSVRGMRVCSPANFRLGQLASKGGSGLGCQGVSAAVPGGACEHGVSVG